MAKRNSFPERRKHKRFKVREGVMAVTSPDYRMGQIKNVSKGGLAFEYLVTTESTEEEPLKVEILSTFDALRLKNLPVRVVSDFELSNIGLSTLISTRQLSLQFGKLNHSQKLLLDHFIQEYT